MMQNYYLYSRKLLEYCTDEEIPYIYASSAAVYGARPEFREDPACEAPLNVYGYSKFLFDQYLRRNWAERTAQVVGLRYFNVYGEREQHKGRMASVAFHCFNQFRAHGKVRLFEGSGGYGNGEQRRDFISVVDAVGVNLFFLDHPEKSGIFNAGLVPHSSNEAAAAETRRTRITSNRSSYLRCSARMIEHSDSSPQKYQSYNGVDIRLGWRRLVWPWRWSRA
jgi:ADP-L-glycero-D-manno-heptose 6-epimerase